MRQVKQVKRRLLRKPFSKVTLTISGQAIPQIKI